MRKKSLFGGATVAAITLSMMGAGPALAETSTVEAAPAETATLADAPAERSDEPCTGVTFPLELDATGESYLVTLADDSSDEGSLRWALDQANAHPGLDEIVIGAGVQVRSTGGLEVGDALILRGADETSEIINVTEDERELISYRYRFEYMPVFIANLTLSGAPEVGATPGIGFLKSVCALGMHDVTLQNFTDFALMAGDTGPFERFEFKDSVVKGTRSSDNGYEASVLISNEGINGDIVIENSTFSDNALTAVLIEAGLESWELEEGGRASLLVENSRFLNNRSDNDYLAAGLSLGYVGYEDLEGESPEDPTVPMAIIRDVVFEGNIGGPSGGFHLEGASLWSQIHPTTTLLSFERLTFARNHAGSDALDEGWAASDFSIGYVDVEDTPDGIALSLSDSTFSDPVDATIPNIRINELGGHHRFEHVTLSGGGVAFGTRGDDNSRLTLKNSVFDTGERDPVSREEPLRAAPGDGVAAGDPALAEDHMAYTTEPALVPAGPGRILGTTADFALGDLDNTLGLTPVRVPGEGSTLIDAAGDSGAATDQRGLARPQGPAADIGAVEVEADAELSPAVLEIGDDKTVKAGEPLVFDVTREDAAEDPWTGEASVRVTTSDGTAKAGTDYTAVDTVLTWAADDVAPKTISAPTDAGHAGEGDVTLTVTLSEPSEHASTGTRDTATGTIQRDADTGVVITPKPDPKPTPDPDPTKDPLANSGGPAATAALIAAGLLAAAGALLLFLRKHSAATRRARAGGNG